MRPSGVGVLDLDDRADLDRRGRGERPGPELDQRVGLGERLLRPVRLGAPEAGELVGGARVLALLVGSRAVACLGGGRVAGRQGGAGRRGELAGQLLDELLLVHADKRRSMLAVEQIPVRSSRR